MKPEAFEMVRPTAIGEVLELLARHGGAAKIIAGGQSLVPMMNLRIASPGILIDINRVADLSGIRRDADRVRIGTLTRQREVLASDIVARDLPLLALAATHIGHVQTRARGTVGGSLAHADPSAELALVMVTLGADLILRSHAGERVVPARDFFQDALVTVLEPEELLAEISIPVAAPGTRVAFKEYARRHGDFAIASAAVQRAPSGALLAGIGGVGSVPHFCRKLNESRSMEALAPVVAEEIAAIDAMTDRQASADYRRTLGEAALTDCLREVLA
jgi:CO/xanthine dehydrogenase FAD-binding subunit